MTTHVAVRSDDTEAQRQPPSQGKLNVAQMWSPRCEFQTFDVHCRTTRNLRNSDELCLHTFRVEEKFQQPNCVGVLVATLRFSKLAINLCGLNSGRLRESCWWRPRWHC